MANRQKKWILCFAPGDYHQFTPSCTTHIMNEFVRRGYRILWINPAPIGLPSVRRSGGWNRIKRRARSYMRPFRRVRSGFYTLSPVPIPGARGKLGAGVSAAQIRLAARILGIRQAITWIENAASTMPLALMPGPKVYQLSDKYELSRYASPQTKRMLAENSKSLVQSADFVTCSARTLWKEIKEVREDVVYLPHAVDLDIFRRQDGPPPQDLAAISRPRIGYFGTLSSSNDQAMIAVAADEHPDWQFVLIGRITGGDWADLQRRPNVHFLGFKPLADIPAYGTHFDAAFMNWHVDDWMVYAHPLKSREYLALGLPVVSCAIPEVVEAYRGQIRIAHDPHEFSRQMAEALAEDDAEKRDERSAWAREHTWAGYIDTVLSNLARESDAATPGAEPDTAPTLAES